LAALAASVAVAVLILAVASRFWPGIPMFDTIEQYRQVLGGPVDDWHPPLMVRLWQLLHRFGSGTAPMFALQVALYAFGFALLVATLVRIGRWRAGLAVTVLALSPLLLGWQMVVLKDLQMLSALLAAVGLIAWFRLAGQPVPLLAAVAAAILILYATLIRANGVFVTAPLSVLVVRPRGGLLVNGGMIALGAVAILALTPIINHHLLHSEPSTIAKAEPVFDLAAIAVRTPRSAPSVFTRAERAQIISRHCVKPYFWDPLGDPSACGRVTERLRDQPAKLLYLKLARAIIRYPGAYALHRLAHWNSTERWLVPPQLPDGGPPDDAEDNDLGLAASTSDFVGTWQDWAADEMGTPLGWPIVWTALAFILLPLAWYRRNQAEGSLAFVLLASAIALEASFLVISIASDLRYHLWPMTASALALILLSDRIRLKSWEWVAASAALAAVVGGGVAARNLYPPAPDSYDAMIAAPTD
jgi:hypothetical protein